VKKVESRTILTEAEAKIETAKTKLEELLKAGTISKEAYVLTKEKLTALSKRTIDLKVRIAE